MIYPVQSEWLEMGTGSSKHMVIAIAAYSAANIFREGVRVCVAACVNYSASVPLCRTTSHGG